MSRFDPTHRMIKHHPILQKQQDWMNKIQSIWELAATKAESQPNKTHVTKKSAP